jgi:hypothetical protein
MGEPAGRSHELSNWFGPVLSCPLSTRSPRTIAGLRADVPHDRQGPGRFQSGQSFNRYDSTILRQCDFFSLVRTRRGEGPQMSPLSRSCPEMTFPVLQAVSCLSPEYPSLPRTWTSPKPKRNSVSYKVRRLVAAKATP